jgi:hypothetical protein
MTHIFGNDADLEAADDHLPVPICDVGICWVNVSKNRDGNRTLSCGVASSVSIFDQYITKLPPVDSILTSPKGQILGRTNPGGVRWVSAISLTGIIFLPLRSPRCTYNIDIPRCLNAVSNELLEDLTRM